MMTDRFYFSDGSTPARGPVSRAELQQMLAAGQLTGDTLVVREGDSTWVRLAQLPPPVPAGGRASSVADEGMRYAPPILWALLTDPLTAGSSATAVVPPDGQVRVGLFLGGVVTVVAGLTALPAGGAQPLELAVAKALETALTMGAVFLLALGVLRESPSHRVATALFAGVATQWPATVMFSVLPLITAASLQARLVGLLASAALSACGFIGQVRHGWGAPRRPVVPWAAVASVTLVHLVALRSAVREAASSWWPF